MLFSLRDVRVSLGGPPLLDGVSLQIDRGERVALVGRNGTGKSTLLRIAEGTLRADAGEVHRAPGLRVARLPQELPADVTGTAFHVTAQGLGALSDLVEQYHRLAQAVADGDPGSLAALERCQHELEAAGGWELEQRVETVLARLALEPDAEVCTLSGGVRRRVLLARALVSDPDLLLLDEPTNHLDIDRITGLEELLLTWPGALLFVTHDRAFLQRIATRILELDRGRLTDFPGDYATYLARKAALLAAEETRNALFDQRLAAEEVWIRQGIKARRTRNEGRVRALERMRRERAGRREQAGQARISVQRAERSGRLVTEAEDAAFAYGDRPVFRALTTTILRGDKVGIIGANGAGKTTLLRVVLGALEPTSGVVRRGTGLEVAYFDQERAALDPERSVQDNVAEGRDSVVVGGQARHVLSYLRDYLFTADRARQPVKALSGGERSRLLLAQLFARPSNVLVLDEPTNDLDADTLELLESLLVEYAGTVLLVSHDRAFLDNVVTSTLVLEGDGRVAEYVGGYTDWLRQRPPPCPPSPTPRESRAEGPGADVPRPVGRGPGKLSYRDRRELDALPGLIEDLEAEQQALHAEMSTAEFYRRGGTVIADARARLARVEEALQSAYARWQALETQGVPPGAPQ